MILLDLFWTFARIGAFAARMPGEKMIIADVIGRGACAVLVIPIDASAPKGRLILPQQQVLRELLDNGCRAVCCRPEELADTLAMLREPPAAVITDSQAFAAVAKIVPREVPLTSFSILFARYKGNLPQLVSGAEKLASLHDGDRVLISEGCTHHRQCEDIGTVKIPRMIENFCGAKPATYEKAKTLCETALELILENTKAAIQDPQDETAREALGVATDLGGYAIMVGGTSGGHLTSFSLIDVVSHGTACGIMNPYYAVFYAPAIQEQLSAVGKVLLRHGFLEQDPEALLGRERAEAVAEGMRAFARSIGAPTTLSELPGFTEAHTKRILSAAKKPELQMKLQNMPVPMTAAREKPARGAKRAVPETELKMLSRPEQLPQLRSPQRKNPRKKCSIKSSRKIPRARRRRKSTTAQTRNCSHASISSMISPRSARIFASSR